MYGDYERSVYIFQSKAGIVLDFADASPAFGIAIAGH